VFDGCNDVLKLLFCTVACRGLHKALALFFNATAKQNDVVLEFKFGRRHALNPALKPSRHSRGTTVIRQSVM
jgi:hypothetical protein